MDEDLVGLWKSDLPRKGWVLVDVIDTLDDGEDFPGDHCQFCGTGYRYEHLICHQDAPNAIYRVGCVCAEKLTHDYVNPRRREKELRSKAGKRRRWITSSRWRYCIDGHLHRIDGSDSISILPADGGYRLTISNHIGRKTYSTLAEAKLAAYSGLSWVREQRD